MTEEEIVEKINHFSMLSADSLKKIRKYARSSKGAIVEVGSYIGGSTCAMADAIRDTDRPYYVLEAGGSYTEHPHLPTDDILRDLNGNLRNWGLETRVNVIPKLSHEAAWELRQKLNGEKIGLLFIDADGNVGPIVQSLSPLIADDCILILDDYGDELKGNGVGKFVDAAKASNCVRELELDNLNATWFGELTKPANQLPPPGVFFHESGFSYFCLPPCFTEPDSEGRGKVSKLFILENGEPLGPAHTQHAEIRSIGLGRFSYWNGLLYFAASDSSDPRTNGRIYTVHVAEKLSTVLLTKLCSIFSTITNEFTNSGKKRLPDFKIAIAPTASNVPFNRILFLSTTQYAQLN